MMLPQNKNSQGGFTLVELMVVVAIIGILSSVAIPSFRKYQAKAKTSEAKLHLASIYSAEVSFFSDSDSYAQCLDSMGYNPSNSANQRYYTTGFEQDQTPESLEGSGATATINGIKCDPSSTNGKAFFVALKKVAGHDSSKDDIKGSNVDPKGSFFVAAAGGRISTSELNVTDNSIPNFYSSMEAHASAGTGDHGDVTVTDLNISVWAVNEQKEILNLITGY